MLFLNGLYLAMLGLATVSVSCGKKDDDETIQKDEVDAIFKDSKIQKEELSGSTDVSPIAVDGLVAEVNGLTTIYNNAPSTGPDKEDYCLTTELNKIVGEAGKNYVKFVKSGSLNPQSCSDASTTYSLLKYEYSTTFSCDKGDLTAANGKIFQVLVAETNTLCPASENAYWISKLKTEVKFTNTADKASYHLTTSWTTSSEDGGPCKGVYENDVGTDDGCIDLSKTTAVSVTDAGGTVILKDKTITYEKFVSKNLKSTRADVTSKYYSSGKYLLTLNNWTGEVNYVGKDTSPVWSLSNGSVDRSGTFVGETKLVGGTDSMGSGRLKIKSNPFLRWVLPVN